MNWGLVMTPTCYPLTMDSDVRQSSSVSRLSAAFQMSFFAWNLPNSVHRKGDNASWRFSSEFSSSSIIFLISGVWNL